MDAKQIRDRHNLSIQRAKQIVESRSLHELNARGNHMEVLRTLIEHAFPSMTDQERNSPPYQEPKEGPF